MIYVVDFLLVRESQNQCLSIVPACSDLQTLEEVMLSLYDPCFVH